MCILADVLFEVFSRLILFLYCFIDILGLCQYIPEITPVAVNLQYIPLVLPVTAYVYTSDQT